MKLQGNAQQPRFLRSMVRVQGLVCLWGVMIVWMIHMKIVSATVSSRELSSSYSSPLPSFSIRIPGSRYEDEDDWDSDDQRGWMGSGREFSLFDSRGGSSRNNNGKDEMDRSNNGNNNRNNDENEEEDEDSDDLRTRELLQRYRRARMVSNRHRFRSSSSSSSPSGFYNGGYGGYGSGSAFGRRSTPQVIRNVQNWWSEKVAPNLEKMPKIVCRVEPTTTLKIRKTFRPLKTIIRLGADFNTQLGVWQFQSSWEDAIIGGKLTLAGRELQLTKSWQLSVGAVEDLVTRLRFRAAINLQTFQAYARVGFRTERLSPINVMEGFTILKRLPLDGSRGNVKLEVKANIALPEPELEYSTETQRSMIGNMGNVEVSIDELNLLLDY